MGRQPRAPDFLRADDRHGARPKVHVRRIEEEDGIGPEPADWAGKRFRHGPREEDPHPWKHEGIDLHRREHAETVRRLEFVPDSDDGDPIRAPQPRLEDPLEGRRSWRHSTTTSLSVPAPENFSVR